MVLQPGRCGAAWNPRLLQEAVLRGAETRGEVDALPEHARRAHCASADSGELVSPYNNTILLCSALSLQLLYPRWFGRVLS